MKLPAATETSDYFNGAYDFKPVDFNVPEVQTPDHGHNFKVRENANGIDEQDRRFASDEDLNGPDSWKWNKENAYTDAPEVDAD